MDFFTFTKEMSNGKLLSTVNILVDVVMKQGDYLMAFTKFHRLNSSSSSSTSLLYLTLCPELMSSRTFCHHLKHLDVTGVLSHHWYLGVGNSFWLCQSSRFFFFHTSFSLYEGFQQVFSLLVFLHQVLEGGQAMIIFSSLLDYSISLRLSSYNILCSFLFLAMPHPWLGAAVSIEKNQFYLQWFLWWSINRCCTGK